MRVALDTLTFRRRIGAGAGGFTYAADYQGGQVAVKMASGGKEALVQWQNEARTFAKLSHPNIVRLVGMVAAPPSYGLVMEYCGGGDLSSALSKGKATPPGFALMAASGVAAGMAHMHQRGVLHRDLKGANVLIDDAGGVKLTDFGIAVKAPDDTQLGGMLTAETGTYRWMAPEVICHERYSRSADIFSFGGVLFELLCHEPPFADRSHLQAAVAVGLEDTRPALPDGTPALMRAAVQACWLREPTARPTFAALIETLGGMSEQLSAEEREWLDAPAGHPAPPGAVPAPTAPSGSPRSASPSSSFHSAKSLRGPDSPGASRRPPKVSASKAAKGARASRGSKEVVGRGVSAGEVAVTLDNANLEGVRSPTLRGRWRRFSSRW